MFNADGTAEPVGPISKPDPVPAIAAVTATATASTVLVNGKSVAFDAYNINGNNYFKLRDLAYILNGTEKQFEVAWDGEYDYHFYLTVTFRGETLTAYELMEGLKEIG